MPADRHLSAGNVSPGMISRPCRAAPNRAREAIFNVRGGRRYITLKAGVQRPMPY